MLNIMDMKCSNLKELTSAELRKYSGGGPILWFIGGYVFSEVMEGIYQAQKKGCLSKK